MLTPRFRLFNRKTELPKVGSESNDQLPQSDISVSNVISLVHAIQSQNIQELCSKLSVIRDAVLKSLKNIEKLANDLELEKVKVEETKFEPIVENSKRIVVSSLRRECSVEMPEPNTHSEAIKFNQRLEAVTSRFREVSTSHNRVFNVFIKKYAGKLKDEFGTLSSQSKEVNHILNEYDSRQKPFLDCKNVLNALSDGKTSIAEEEQRIQDNLAEVRLLKNRLRELKLQMVNVENSAEFHEYARVNNEIRELEQKKVEIRSDLISLFSPISRALTKYSYGMPRQTSERLNALSDEPWIILDKEFGPYFDILIDIRKELNTERIRLKDAPKVSRHLDKLLNDLPTTREKYQTTQQLLWSLYQRINKNLDRRSLELKEEIARTSRHIEVRTNESSQLQNQLKEKQLQLDQLRKEAEACLYKIFGKKYNLLV